MSWKDWLLPKSNAEGFAKRVIGILSREGLADRVELRFQGKTLHRGTNDSPAVINLDNIYSDYSKMPRRLRAKAFDIVLHMARDLDAVDIPREQAIARLLPMVRDKANFQIACGSEREVVEEKWLSMRSMNDELACGLCVDLPDSMSMVGGKQLKEWNLTEDEAYKVARDNLAKQSETAFKSIAPGIYVSDFGDYHDASRLVLPELFVRLNLRGDPVVAVPNRSIVLVTGSRDDRGLEAIANIAREQLAENRPLTATLFRLENFEWHPMLPAPDSPAYAAVRNAASVSRAMRYDEQLRMLSERCERDGIDRFIAKHTLMQSELLPVMYSWTSWVKGVDNASMPVADLVAVSTGEALPNFALWDDVIRISGHRLTRTADSPQRYELTTWPTDEEIAQMNARPTKEILPRLASHLGISASK